jgi:hydrogenase maturation protease
MTGGRTVVIGVGNPYRRDDGLGPAVVELLRHRRIRGVELAESDGDLGTLIDLWDHVSLAVVVDAIRTLQAHPGRVHRLSAYHPSAIRSPAAASTHGIDLGEAVALARALDRMPQRLLLFAVEVSEVGFGVGLSPAVTGAVATVAAEIAELVALEVA